MAKKINIKLNSDFKRYAIKQISFILFITFVFFVIFLFNLGLVMASLLIWVIIVIGFLFVYLDLKYYYLLSKQTDEINNLKYVINNLK